MPILLQNFESIGENCEFGFVQRALGDESSSLLRWAFLDNVAAVTVGIQSGFEGVFAFNNLFPAGGGTMVRDITAGVAFHTGMRSELRNGVWQFSLPEEERRKIHANEMQKFLHLRHKFRRNLISGNKIYVAKRNGGLTEQDAGELMTAISKWGKGRLLFLNEADGAHPSGTIDRVEDRVIQGWIDHFAPISAADAISLLAWESVLRETSEAFAGQQRKRSRPSRRRAEVAGGLVGPPDGEIARDEISTGTANLLPIHKDQAGNSCTSSALESSPLPSSAELDEESRLTAQPGHGRGSGRSFGTTARPYATKPKRPDLADWGSAEERMLLKIMGRQGDVPFLVPNQFFQDEYFTNNYPGARNRPSGVSMPKVYRPTAGYFSARSRAIAERLRNATIHRNRAVSYQAKHNEQLKKIFVPDFYASLVGLATDDPVALWNHYVDQGLPAGIAPTPLFDPDLYRHQLVMADLPPRQFGEPLVIHWLRVGSAAGIVPSPFFDRSFYLASNADLKETTLEAFEHYLASGLYEGRAPNIWFDPRWYADHSPATVERFDHFVAIGMHEGRTPSALVHEIMNAFGPTKTIDPNFYAVLVEASVPWQGKITADALFMMVRLYSADWQDPAKNPLDAFLAYLSEGMPDARKPGPLFDQAVYRRRVAGLGLTPLAPADSAMLHWLMFGYAARIVPTERFDELIYRAKHPDIASTQLWGFAHYVLHGLSEGRVATATPMFRNREVLPRTDAVPVPAMCRHWYAMDFPDAAAGIGDEIPKAAYDRLNELLSSELLATIFAEAQAIDPEVGELASIDDLLLPPYYDGLSLRDKEVRRRLPKLAYSTVICVPWIRVGGADLVAGLLAKALLRIRPWETVLVLRVDWPHFERADWLPDQADVVDISDLVAGLAIEHQERLLHNLLRGVGPRRVINVNSRLCWSLFKTYGANLKSTMNLYAYMFCWDQTSAGLRVGYPAEFYANTADNVTAFLTDTNYLRDELAKMYRLPRSMSDRIVPVFTPAQSKVWTPSAARIVQNNGEPGSRRMVLWAGRLDRQKRFDLVQEIARLMPDVAFHCWGAAVLDSHPDLSALPANVHMQGSFASFDDLPLTLAGAWLFTALWEGMPTTIIELATRGVPIVASAVGGVPELIDHETGWPVDADATVAMYATTLREALSTPEEATRRAESLQQRVAKYYTEQNYDSRLAQLFNNENGEEA